MKKILLLFLVIINFNVISLAQVTFQKIIGGTFTDNAYAIEKTTDKGFIVIGSSRSFSTGYNQIYLIKTDSLGSMIWSKVFGSPLAANGYSIQQTSDLGYIITGQSTGLSNGDTELFLIKADELGNIIWIKVFSGIENAKGNCVKQTNDGGYIICGTTNNFGFNLDNAYLIKTNDVGDTLWTKVFGGIADDYGLSVVQTSDDGYILTGYSSSVPANGWQAILIKTDAMGDTLWTKLYGGINVEMAYAVGQTFDGGYIVTGTSSGIGIGNYDIFLLKTDASGIPLWTKTYGGVNSEIGYYVQQTIDTGYIIAGRANSFGFGNNDGYLIKTDFNGDTLWTKVYGDINSDRFLCVQQTDDLGFVAVGTINNVSTNIDDMFFIKTDSNGNSGCNESNANSNVSNILIPYSAFPLTISSGADISSPSLLTNSGGTITTNCFSVGLKDNIFNQNLSIYPNPSSGRFTIEFPEMILNGDVQIYNLIGENIYCRNIDQTTSLFVNLTGISSGIYFVKISDEGGQFIRKIIVE